MKQSKVGHYIVLIIMTIILLLPILFTLIYSFSNGWIQLAPSGFPSFTNWRELFADSPIFWRDVVTSIWLSVVPIFISLVCMILVMYTVVMHFPKLDGAIQSISMIPYTIRGVVLAISVLTLYAGKGTIFSDRTVMLISLYSVIILPFVYRGLRNNLYAINAKQIVEAAQLLGASGLYTFFRIIVPNMMTGIAVSALLSFGALFTDYPIVKLVGGSRYETAQVYLLTKMKLITGSKVASYIIMIFLIIYVIAMLSYTLQGRMDKKNTVRKDEGV